MRRIIGMFLPGKDSLKVAKEISKLNLDSMAKLQNFLKSYGDINRAERKAKLSEISDNKSNSESVFYGIAQSLKDLGFDLAYSLMKINRQAYTASSIFVSLSIERLDTYILKLSDLAFECIKETDICVNSIHHRKSMKEHCGKIRSIHKETEELHIEAMSELFHFFKNSIDIIKFKQAYDSLKHIVDLCDESSYILQRI